VASVLKVVSFGDGVFRRAGRHNRRRDGLDRHRGCDHNWRGAGRDRRIGRLHKRRRLYCSSWSRCCDWLLRLSAALHEQGHQTDAVNGEDEEDRDLHAGTALVLLLQSGALWNEWVLVVHFQMALLRLSIEALVEFVRFAPGLCLKKTPEQNFDILASLHC
jgi:hypothetical protein